MAGPRSTFQRLNQDHSVFLEKAHFSSQLLSFVAPKRGSLNEENGTGGDGGGFKFVLCVVAFSM